MKPRHKRAALIAGGLGALMGLDRAYWAIAASVLMLYQGLDFTRAMVTDTAKEVSVSYTGILPDLFREGKGVVAQGKLGDDGLFRATEVLAKHDENYMPPEAQHAVDQAQKTIETLK